MSKQNQIKQECNGCEFNCQLGAQWKVGTFFPRKYYPTINSSKIETYTDFKGRKHPAITSSKNAAIMYAIIETWRCARYNKER